MKRSLLICAALATLPAGATTGRHRNFEAADGRTVQDRIVKYDHAARTATLFKNGRFALDAFSEADQAYILQWNQAEGFLSPMRFKTGLKRSNWARLKHEQIITPYYMDAMKLPGKETPAHFVVLLEDYEERDAVYLEAVGYEISLRNQNLFPIENIVVGSKVFFEQEHYVVPDDFFRSSDSGYNKTVATNKVRFLSESIPVIVPQEEVVLYSESATLVDHQLDRNQLVTSSASGDEGDDGADEMADTVDGFGDWDDHGRRRRGKLVGCWVRIGIMGPEGQMVWRDITDPSNLRDKVDWEGTPAR